MRALAPLLAFAVLAALTVGAAAEDKPIDESKLKVPQDVSGWLSYIDKKWESTKDEEVATVKVCARNLKDAVGKDNETKRKFLKKFTGYKELAAERHVNAAMIAARIDGKTMRKELETLRAAANTAIENPKYTEKDNCKLQPEVDKAVKPLLELWNDPMAYAVAYRKLDLKTPAAKLDRLNETLSEVESTTGGWGEGIKDAEAWMARRGNEIISLKKVDLEKAKKTLDDNEKIDSPDFDAESKKHVRLVNDYRIALGRPAVAVHLMLCRACNSHAKWMNANNKIGHDFPGHPDGPSPNDRSQKAGFKGKVAENVTGARDAQNAFDKWYKAAEHHRNMVRFSHLVLGVGHDADKWCQNFSGDTD